MSPPPRKGHLVRNILIVVGALIVIGICSSALSQSAGNKQTASKPTATPTTAPTSKPTVKPTTAPPTPTLTSQQQNAARSARSYLSFAAFSRQGLIDQLSSSAGDQYPVQDATVAVDSLNVDWNAEAVQSAKEYLKFSSFSCQGLIDQLDSSAGSQFTVAQATYGAQQAGAC